MSAIDVGHDRQPWALAARVAGWLEAGVRRTTGEALKRPRATPPLERDADRLTASGCGAGPVSGDDRRRSSRPPQGCPRRAMFGAGRRAPCAVAAELVAEQQRGRQIARAVSHYVAPHVLDRLMEDPDGLSLGGETRDVTVLFADIRGFTALAESLRDDPVGLTRIVAAVMGPLTDIVLAHGGVIDKYMGDGVMAFWGAPVEGSDHAGDAFDAASAMLAAMDGVNRRLQLAFAGLPPIEIGIGLNSGACVVGNLGSRHRFDYSVLGDPVNVASRIEGLCRTYDAPLLLGEETARRLGPKADLVEVDRVLLRGRSTPQAIYAPRAAAETTP